MTGIIQADAEHIPLADGSVDLVFGSPPYLEARKCGARKLDAWVDWMASVTFESLEASKGPVIWVASGTGNYNPACEGLMWRMRNHCHVLRPCIWTKNSPPTGKGWFSNGWEFVMAFTRVKPLPYWNPEAIGTPIKYKSGGHFRQRSKNGERRKGSDYPTHTFRKRPSNVFHVTVGGGHMGHPLACENESPYPEKLVEPFIKALCPEGGTVFDPFGGSGTTAAVARRLGRNCVTADIRMSQCELTRRRLSA